MAGRENTLKKYVMGIMGTRWHAQSHEDMLSAGIPDLSFSCDGVSGWIELKHIQATARTAILKPAKFTNEQVNWMQKRTRHGGKCFVLVQVTGRGYFLFRSGFARAIKDGMPPDQFQQSAIMHWSKSIDPDQLVTALTRENSDET